MTWVKYIDISLYTCLVCSLIGYLTLGLFKHQWRPNREIGHLVAFILGAALIGFSAGFFGTILLTPTAPQGPLLGIFITGPAGAIVALVGFLAYALKLHNKQK